MALLSSGVASDPEYISISSFMVFRTTGTAAGAPVTPPRSLYTRNHDDLTWQVPI